MPSVLDQVAIESALADLPGWSGDTNALTRTAELADFPTAIRVVDEVAGIAEERDHHPDIDIRWRTLTFNCATHSAGGVTSNDIELAAAINEILANHPHA